MRLRRRGSATAPTLGGEGVEHYDGFFRSFAPPTSIRSIAAMARDRPGQLDAVLLARLHPSRPDERARQVERQKAAIDLAVRLGHAILPHAERPGAIRA